MKPLGGSVAGLYANDLYGVFPEVVVVLLELRQAVGLGLTGEGVVSFDDDDPAAMTPTPAS